MGEVVGKSGVLTLEEVKAAIAFDQPRLYAAGQVILDESESLGANLLVKGAYMHSRLRQMIFGGPTRYILKHASIPVLLAH